MSSRHASTSRSHIHCVPGGPITRMGVSRPMTHVVKIASGNPSV